MHNISMIGPNWNEYQQLKGVIGPGAFLVFIILTKFH